ncbi:ATP-binding protein [Mesobacillus maritimus]|uniref:ATP-binding protein n=1 Tax=Mesobacillus maritimus TaxID=1643336 RepID=UPI00203F18C2|nr:ATP-binding protein [Mesobacillus maritimus]MCM3586677.1 ATP-binding protein [Mesobacillus maritimus]MCM3668569.1 ATP-binding protein [Mesobacillus maritimus]
MDLQIDKILLQILMVLFPIILYQALQNNRQFGKNEKVYWGIVFTITMALCILYAIKIKEGVYLDLRMVPWFLAFIYGGKSVGIFVTLFYAFLRFLVGGPGMGPAFLVLFLGGFVILEFRKYYFNWTRSIKIVRSMLLTFVLVTLLPILGIFLLGNSLILETIHLIGVFILANVLSVWLAVHLFESHREKQELIKEIQKNEKLQVVGQVAASVAHEIRNPMTSIRGFIQLLTGSKNIDSTERNYLNICIDELDRANDIISDYLSLGKKHEQEPQQLIDVSALALKSVNTLYSYANLNNAAISIETSEGAIVLGASSRLQQLIINLIKNAIEASKQNGKIHVSVLIKGDQVEMNIEDSGIGMTGEQLENIGLPYYSTKEKGTGLGLMVSLQIIKEMNGYLNVQSKQNKGTIFKITFPLAKQENL